MTELEKNPDPEVEAGSEIETETMAETEPENPGEQQDDSLQESDRTQENAPGSDAFDITRKFKHNRNQIPTPRQAAQDPQQEREIPKKHKLVGVTDKKVETKRILYFLALCFGVAWVLEIFAIIPMYHSDNVEVVKQAVDMISQLMLTPALAALVIRLATREGLVKSGFQFNFFEYKALFLLGWFGTTALTFAGALIYFLVFRDNFDPNMTAFVASYSESAANAGAQIDAVNIIAAYKTDLLIKVFTAAVLDFINSFGEEWAAISLWDRLRPGSCRDCRLSRRQRCACSLCTGIRSSRAGNRPDLYFG